MKLFTRCLLHKVDRGIEHHSKAHMIWRDICKELDILREKNAHSLIVAYTKSALSRIDSFDENDLPPFSRVSLLREVIQSFSQMGKHDDALECSSKLISELRSGDDIQLIKSQQAHGFLLLQRGNHEDIKEAQRLFALTLSHSENSAKKVGFPIFWIDYQRHIPIGKVGLAIAQIHENIHPTSSMHGLKQYFASPNQRTSAVGIREKAPIEMALKALYDNLPILCDNDDNFYAAMCLWYIYLVHSLSGSSAKADDALKKLYAMLKENEKLARDINIQCTDINRSS